MERHAVSSLPVLRESELLGRLTRVAAEDALRFGLEDLRAADLAIRPAPEAGRGRAADLGTRLRRWLGDDPAALVRLVGELAAGRGEAAYLVGGPLRDLLLRRPNRDLDIVVEGDAPGLARAIGARLGRPVRSHAAFGTATVELAPELHVDLATARSETYRAPGALPQVEPAGLELDLRRRDFTVNCLAAALTPGRFGRLLDPCGGRGDLRRRRLRVLHGLSFVEDPTRLFRALRFAQLTGFDLEEQTARLFRVAVRRGFVERLSPARLRRELSRNLERGDLVRSTGLLGQYRLWQAIDPALSLPRRMLPRLRRLERALAVHRPARGRDRPARWVAVLALLSLDLHPVRRRRVIDRLGPGRQDRTLLGAAPRETARLLRAVEGRPGAGPARIARACSVASPLAAILACAVTPERRARGLLERYLAEWNRIRADLTGRDLLAAGIPQGPAVARGLRAALEAKLEGAADGREKQLAAALRAAGRTRRRGDGRSGPA